VLSLTPTADPLAAIQRAAEAAELMGTDAHDLTTDPQALTRVVRDRTGAGARTLAPDRAGTHLPPTRPDVGTREGPRSSRVSLSP
jgi:hypothetical protein